MDTTQWPQGLGFMKTPPTEELFLTPTAAPATTTMMTTTTTTATTRPNQTDRKLTRPQKEQALPCPRCNSTNTKFCYYNNYSLTQPRYFCKACRRYWTEGGSLRSVPVGGGSRKNKRHSVTNKNITTTNINTPVLPVTQGVTYNNNYNVESGMSAMELLRSTGIGLPTMSSMPMTTTTRAENLFPMVDYGNVQSNEAPPNLFWMMNGGGNYNERNPNDLNAW